jgi:hypothetical protein
MRGDGREPVTFAPAAEQHAALDALLETLKPSALALPRELLGKIPPRPSGYGNSRELFPRYTGQMFDAITPAVVASDMTVGYLLAVARAARLVEQHALDPALPGLDTVIDQLLSSTFGATSANPYEAEIARAVQRVVERLMTLASRRHAAGAGDCEPEAPAARAAPGGSAIDQRRRIRARGDAGVGHQAIPRSAVRARDTNRDPDSSPGRADRRSGDGLARTARPVLLVGGALDF